MRSVTCCEGQRADVLAAKYDLAPETNDLMVTSSKGYAMALPSGMPPEEGLAGQGRCSSCPARAMP
jgi:hypothetical protein